MECREHEGVCAAAYPCGRRACEVAPAFACEACGLRGVFVLQARVIELSVAKDRFCGFENPNEVMKTLGV